MSDYRVYIIGIDGHRFIKADQFMSDHPDDATAMKAAEQLVDGYDVELWDCARLVGRIAHKSRTNAICDDQTKASGSDTDLANLRVVAGPIEKAADLRSKVDVSTAPDPPRDESAIILEDDASGTHDVAHWSPEAGEWVGENGEPTKITSSHWYSMPREKYLSLESDGSSNPSQVRPSPARARRYATFSIAAALVAAALIGTYFREDVAALVTRYAGQQDVFGGSTIGEPVVVRGTQLQSEDSQKTNSLALRQQEEAEADQASAQEAAQVKQAAESGTVGLRKSQHQEKSQQQERERADRLEQDLAAARHDVETQTALAAKASKETSELKQAAESGAVELRKSRQQEQDLAAARHDVETQTALAAKASKEASELKQAAESGAVELRKALQQEQERAKRLEQDLAAARLDVETQTAQAAKASKEASELKQAAESGAVELRKSLQQEQERAKRLEQDLAAARLDVETQTAQAAKASKEASELKQAAESGAVELRKSLQQEQERAKRLEQDLAAARLDVETQTAQAAKASDEAGQLKQVAESGSAELKRSLQQEHGRAEALAQDLSMARTTIYAYEAQSRKAGGEAADLKQAAESAALELRKSLQQEQERAKRLEQDLAAARHDVETQTAQAAKASTEAAELKQAAKSGAVELRKSLQQEQERAKRLEQDLAAARHDVETQTAQAVRATTEATELKQAAKSGAAEMRKSVQQEQERAARLQQDLAAARRDVEAQGALAAKASAEAVQLKQLADSGEKLRISLQQEHDRAARPERDLAFERNARAAPAAPKLDQNAQDKQLEANADQASVAAVRGAAPLNPEDAAEVARLVARAGVLLGQGDIGSARIVLERAAESGSAQASFMLAETYDPFILPKWGTYGTRGDATKARDLYAQAEAGGVKEAKARFDALRR